LLGGDAPLELGGEDPHLALAGAARATAGAGVSVPSPREAEEIGAAALAMRGEHRADAALAVGVGADDDVVGAHAIEHRDAGRDGQAIDRLAQLLDRASLNLPCHGPPDRY